jgi:hypothetical protein
MADVPKPVLDFLLRPATMTSRQHSGYQAFYKTGKTRSATAIPLRRREGTGMTVWFMRRLQCLLCVETPTNDRRDNVLRTRERAHALNHGGAID